MDQERPKTAEQEAIVPAGKPSNPTTVGEAPKSPEQILNRLRALSAPSHEGDAEAPRRIRRVLEETPRAVQILSNIVARQAEGNLIKRITGGDPLLAESLALQLQAMREEIAGFEPSPLERLLAERIVVCWLQLQHAEAVYASNLANLTVPQIEHHQRRLDRIHKRYLSAIRTLAQVRKLLKPAVRQINVAEQQVNITSERLSGDS